jgi:hypothetical protein
LDELQPTRGGHPIPIDWDLGMTHEQIRMMDLLGDALLIGQIDSITWGGTPDGF